MFEAVIVVGATLLSAQAVRNFGLVALGLTAAVHVASLFAGDFMSRGIGWLQRIGRFSAVVALVALLVLAAAGALALYNHGLRGIM
jgi:hypothetical protein